MFLIDVDLNELITGNLELNRTLLLQLIELSQLLGLFLGLFLGQVNECFSFGLIDEFLVLSVLTQTSHISI